MAINCLGPVHVCSAFLPGMIETHAGGRIVNIASDAGRVGSAGETIYAGAKGGVIALTKSLAREMARHQITVNCVCPGPTDTPLFHAQPEKLKEALVDCPIIGFPLPPSGEWLGSIRDIAAKYADTVQEFYADGPALQPGWRPYVCRHHHRTTRRVHAFSSCSTRNR